MTPDPRSDLLDRVFVRVASHGLNESLRDLAAAIGTSHRMLLYHFGSRAGLVAAIVERMESEQRSTLQQLASEASGPADLVRRQWAVLTAPTVLPYVRLFFEVLAQAVAGEPGTEGFLKHMTEPWMDLGSQIADEIGLDLRPEELRAGIAVTRGLLADVLAGCPVDVATAALEAHLERWSRPAA